MGLRDWGMEIFRYDGYFDAGRVAVVSDGFRQVDLAYVDSLTQGHLIDPTSEEDEPPPKSNAGEQEAVTGHQHYYHTSASGVT